MESEIDFERLFAGVSDVVPCESPRHSVGLNGCIPRVTDAQWAIDHTHAPKGEEPFTVLVCVGYAAWMRARMSNTMTCDDCGISGPVDQFYRLRPLQHPQCKDTNETL